MIVMRAETEKVMMFLDRIVNRMTEYVNSTTIHSLEKEGTSDNDYLLELLKAARRLLVFCEEGLDACRNMLNNQSYHEMQIKQLLEKVYYQCIERFFHPKNDVWYENSRSAYSNTNAIIFRKAVPPSFSKFIYSLEAEFQMIREEVGHRVQSHF